MRRFNDFRPALLSWLLHNMLHTHRMCDHEQVNLTAIDFITMAASVDVA
jgi:hypothetical protein